MIKQNLHTHSTYCDGKDSIEEMVLEAIEKGFTTLGFSGHGYNKPLDEGSMNDEEQENYIHDVLTMKEKYKDKIDIYLGIEQDSIGRYFKKGQPFDYIIGSVHFVPYKDTFKPVDYSQDVTDLLLHEEYHDDFLEYAKTYYEAVSKQADMNEVDIIGHLDLLTKYNEEEEYISFTNPEYLQMAYNCIDRLIEKGKILEVNTGAIARSLRKTQYPHRSLLEYIQQKGGKICLNSDCHNRKMLDCYYKEALTVIKECGFITMMAFTSNGFVERPIEEFCF